MGSASKELSEKMVELNKRNKYKPRNWVYGRSKLTDEGEIIVKDLTTVEVVQALKGPITTQTGAGLFTPQYHKDELAKAIGTKEHDGRVRGVSSSATWKEGFSDTSSHLYKKHTLNRKEREDKAKEDWRRQLLMFAIDKESGRLDPNLLAAMDAFLRGSSTSTQPSISTQPSVSGQPSVPRQSKTENITEDTSCELHVPFCYKGKTMKVASDTAFSGEMLHNRDIPPGYVRVTVSETIPGYKDNEIKCPIPEAGIETLQDVLGSLIIWKRRDVVLSPRVSPLRLSGHGSFHASQPINTGGQPSRMSVAASGTSSNLLMRKPTRLIVQ
ncbi:hypothetical protein PR202_ga28108 [Eleusine coracana subsp. coracana]|uniref:DUF8039 domain-containing protein n=1 Tax=Eleusine coracana subsp. coracana TaxID=191504 RepID=A0AAV5DGC0_ELECO|nr:hypothetical protein PR202_ga28108 [Eleusine coracana subsp. coracana]